MLTFLATSKILLVDFFSTSKLGDLTSTKVAENFVVIDTSVFTKLKLNDIKS
jgi:hypothetical protein